MARNGLKKAVYVGDTAGDEKAARDAGCSFIHAAYGFGQAEAPDAAAQSPAELEVLIHGMEEEQNV
jgi:phosphoglycolate phosphatase